ncbi:YdcF family protein [Methylobacterium thuringiense]|nr:YdcF family protein [Methylobacterium thuringiense]
MQAPSVRQRPSRLRFAVRGLVGAAALGALVLLGGFLAFVSTIERMERRPSGRADGIVALTGGAQRVGDAIELLAGGYGRRLLISGVNERTSREEIVRLNPSQGRWIDCCVDLDYRARNTIGNAIETRRWMRRNHFETIAVVTSNYHMPRTLVEIEHALAEGESVVAYPVVTDGFEIGRWWQDPAVARLVGAEYVKFLAAWLRTRIEGDPERSHFAVLIGRGKPSKAPVRMVAEPHLHAAN